MSQPLLQCHYRISTRVLFCNIDSWINHGKPPGANVAAIADVGTVKPDILFTVR